MERYASGLIDAGSTRVTSSGPPPTPAQIPTNELVALMSDRYRILRRIGRGGMGEVFLAEHTAIGKQVAIKILSEDFARKPRIVQRFLQEARASSAIRHENVVDITDYGHTPSGLPFLAMEYLVGEDLKATLRREGWLAWPRARRMVLQLLAGLAAAHSQGVIHRDIKPDNCFRLERGDNPDFIKVLDFGIAKVINEEVDQHLTQTGVVMGTAEYMSPEQARSDPIDARTDLYAVGVILFEMLTGRVPFRANGFMGTLSKHIMESPPLPRQVAPLANISRALERVMLKALAKEPDDRFQSAEAFAKALRALPPSEDGASASGPRNWPMAGLAMVLGLAGMVRWAFPGGPIEHAASPEVVVAARPEQARLEALVPDAMRTDEGFDATWSEHGTMSAGVATEEAVVSTMDVTSQVDVPSATDVTDAPTVGVDPAKKREHRSRRLPEKLSPAALGAGFAAVEGAVGECRQHGGVTGTVVHVQLTVTAAGKVEGASARKPYQGTTLGRCVEAAASRASFPAAQTSQRAEPGFKL
ncbi:MAG: serine/threonine protein kinase [Nannocystis sp.]|nr:serine/threonine-protein kinase [Nannocystis sp.]MBA3545877.1 serine/threonine protein kinase [Nannocystis sp.]